MPQAALSAKQGRQLAQALGRSRGGFSTKIHLVVDALGNPLDFVLKAGQAHDIKQGPALLQGRRCDYIIADKGYDAAHSIEFIEAMGTIPIVPARKNRLQPRHYDIHLYIERHLIECFINKIKWFRRIFPDLTNLPSTFSASWPWFLRSSGYAEMSTVPSASLSRILPFLRG